MARPAAALLLAALCLLQLCLLTRASASRRLLAADSTDAAADVDVELPKEKEALHHPNADGEVVGQAPADSTAAVDVRLQDLMSDDYPYQSAEAVAQAPVEDAAASAVDTTAAAADTVAADVASSGAASAQQITARYGLGCDDYNVGTYRNMAFQTCVITAVQQEALWIITRPDGTCKLYRSCTIKEGNQDDALYALPAYGAGVPGKKCTENNFFSESGLSALDCKIEATLANAYAYIFRVKDGTCKMYNECTAKFDGSKEILYIQSITLGGGGDTRYGGTGRSYGGTGRSYGGGYGGTYGGGRSGIFG
eukprot:jgi/Tetstr1/426420/TSEL_016728.t1